MVVESSAGTAGVPPRVKAMTLKSIATPRSIFTPVVALSLQRFTVFSWWDWGIATSTSLFKLS